MKQPKSKLPWKKNDEGDDIITVENASLNTSWDCPGGCYFYEEEDVNYILQACNNFPRAVELLRQFVKIGDLNNQNNLNEICILDITVEEFLKEIGESV